MLPLRSQLPSLLLLLWRQVFPGLNPVQPALLFLRRQVVEVLQPIHQSLLLLLRKPPKLWIALQRLLLVGQRKVAMTFQPVAAVTLACGWRSRNLPIKAIRLRWPGNFLRGSLPVCRPFSGRAVHRFRRRMGNRALLLLRVAAGILRCGRRSRNFTPLPICIRGVLPPLNL